MYRANIETDTIMYGNQLENGMRVLIEEQKRRQVVTGDNYLSSRWCVVTNLVQTNFFTKFTGIYDDGTLGHREEPNDIPWIVRKDSIPAKSESKMTWRKWLGRR